MEEKKVIITLESFFTQTRIKFCNAFMCKNHTADTESSCNVKEAMITDDGRCSNFERIPST